MARSWAVLLCLAAACGGAEGRARRLAGSWQFTVAGGCDAGRMALSELEDLYVYHSIWGTWDCGTGVGRDVRVTVSDDGTVGVSFFKEPRTVTPYVYQWFFTGRWTDDSISGSAEDGTVFRATRVHE
jgi:hypothetical protein